MINIEVSRFSNLNTGKKQITTAKTTKSMDFAFEIQMRKLSKKNLNPISAK